MESIKLSNTVPCKDCINRQPGCHSKCDAYTQYSNERMRMREQQRLQNYDLSAFIARVNKHKRRKNAK